MSKEYIPYDIKKANAQFDVIKNLLQEKKITTREWFAGMSLMGRRANPNMSQMFYAEDCLEDADCLLEAIKASKK